MIDALPASTLPELNIGSVPIGFPVAQAALSGYSDMAMRVIARRLGASYTLNEVVLDQFVIVKSRKMKRYACVLDEEHPVGGQLMGANPREFGAAARGLAQAGYDVIDINFGCPVKKVLGRCRGGFLLTTPDTALEIVSRVRDAVPPHIPVTVKMRRGMDDSSESLDQFLQILVGAFERGVAAVTLHPRTVKQRYVGPSRWEFLRQIKTQFPRFTILGSGDLFTAQDCLDMFRQTGVDGITVARGAIGNPWIFREIRALAAGLPLPDPPSLFEQREVIREHYRLAEELYGPDPCGRQMRKCGIKYAQLHPQYLDVREAFIQVRTTAQWPEVLERWYAQDGPGVRPAANASMAEEGCET